MALYIGDKLIAGSVDGQQLNNPFSLLDYKYSEYELDNASWLISNGQYNSGATYPAVYNLLLAIYNGTVTKAGVSVKLSTETYADTDFVLNTTDTTFRLPLKVALASGKAVVGNGMTLGLTIGTKNYGMASGANYGLQSSSVKYGANVGESLTIATDNPALTMGITQDPLKSGIETSTNGLYLYFYVGETVQDANIIVAGQALTDIADLKNLSNLSPLGQKVIDGQWVLSELQVFVNATITTTHQRYTLASYLPDDEYDYEVLVQVGTANSAAVNIASDLDFRFGVRGASSVSAQLYNDCILPVGSGRYIEAYTTSGTSSNSQCVIRSYRRIGTNS